MARFSVQRLALLTSVLTLLAAVQLSPQESAAARRAVGSDPAVTAFTTFVVGKERESPADRALVVAALDRLACAIEGLALARNVLTDVEFARIHKLRRDVRALGISADTSALTKARAGIFVTTAQLLRDLDGAVPRGADKALINSLDLSADGLDRDYPLKWQPDAMENFFEFAAKLLQQIDQR